jgi:hypothetical protein
LGGAKLSSERGAPGVEIGRSCSEEPHSVSRWLIVLGLVLIVIGVLWPLLSKLGLGRLPGDIVIERENFQFYFPIMTSLLVSLVLSIILWLIDR